MGMVSEALMEEKPYSEYVTWKKKTIFNERKMEKCSGNFKIIFLSNLRVNKERLVHIFNPSTPEAEASGSVSLKPGLSAE